jgi:VanZ family protein
MYKPFKSKNYQTLESIGFIAFITTILVQNFIRPNSKDYDEMIKQLLGVLPNFLAGIGMSMAIFIYNNGYFEKIKLNPEKRMLASVILSILGLTLWEYIQIFAYRPFDINDVIATILGSLLSAVLIYLNINYNKKLNLVEF